MVTERFSAKPTGKPIRVSRKGRKHFHSFEFCGKQYTLENTVLLAPETKDQKPYVVIIKDIKQSLNGSLKITGQRFYRPDEAERNRGGSWKSKNTRELFYSFHQDKFAAEKVMHMCVVHFIPKHKQLPTHKQLQGFIVQKVYDKIEKKLRNVTDRDYEDNQQEEIDELVQKTIQRLGELPDIAADQEALMKNKRILKKKSISPYYRILVKFNALTGDTRRDKHLVMLLQNVQYLFDSDDSIKKQDNSDSINNGCNNKSLEIANECKDNALKNSKSFVQPDVAVPALVALEKASHDAFSPDYHKYSQNIRQLALNLKNNAFLLRLLEGKLEPSKILNLTHTDLKEFDN